jgi:hypothetical protein
MPVPQSRQYHSFSIKEKQIWAIREVKTKAKRNNRKRRSVVRRKNEDCKGRRRISKYGVIASLEQQLARFPGRPPIENGT